MIEKIAPTTLDPALRDAVLPRALIRRLNWVDLHRSDGNWDRRPIFRITVEDQEAESRFERKGLSQLLPDPHACGMLRDVEVQNLPWVMPDCEKAVEHPKVIVGNLKKSMAVIASRWLQRNASHRFAGSGLFGARRIHREIVLSETSKPSTSSSS
jgi:hypothetical protein